MDSNDSKNENDIESGNGLEKLYSDCVNKIKALRLQMKQYQNSCNNAQPLVLSSYLKSDKAYYPAANKERNGTMRFACRHTLKGHFEKIYSLSWCESGYLSSTGQDQKLIIWSGDDNNNIGKKLCVIDTPDLSGIGLSFSSKKGEYVACGGLNNQCTIYKINYSHNSHNSQDIDVASKSHTKINCLTKHKGFISDCILMNDSTEIVTSSGDSKIFLWDIENSLPTQEFIGHKSDVMAIKECNIEYFHQSSGHGKLLLSASTDGTCKLWDYRQSSSNANNCVFTYYLHNADVNCCSWFPDGNAFASGSEDGTIKLIDIRTHKQLNVFKSKDGAFNSVHSICFSKSGYWLFAGLDGDQYCQIWKTATTQQRAPLPHEKRVSSITLSPSGNKIATSCWDCNVRLWA